LMFSLFYLFLPTGIRHHGHLFILLLLCLWLDGSLAGEAKCAPGKFATALAKPFLSVVLLIQSLVGAYAYSVDWRYEFSGAAQAVQFIRSNDLERLPIVGMRTWETSVFSGYLDRQIYYPEAGHLGSFVIPPSEYPSYAESWALVRQFVSTHGTVLVILDKTISSEQLLAELAHPMSDSPSRRMTARLLGEFDGEIVTKETYCLYVVHSDDS